MQGSTEITLWFRVAKQRNQTNSNLLGMDQAPQGARPYFFRVGPPVKSQAPSFKLDRVQALGEYKIMKGINYVN